MDKLRLTTLIREPHQLTTDDAKALKELKRKYPYFQALTPLIVMGDKKFFPKAEKQDLQSAAIYSLDRRHLKKLLDSVQENDTELVSKNSQKIQESKETNTVIVKAAVSTNKNLKLAKLSDQKSHLPDSFFTELTDEMDALKASKERYQRILAKLEEGTPVAPEAKSKPKQIGKKAAVKKKLEAARGPQELNPEQEHNHDLIEEIEQREKKAIKDQHKKEQIALITSFIENEPILSKKFITNDPDTKKVIEDLSVSSTNLSEDVISETLAKLMVRQGRNHKAIDIYKKLIWKFPQKKSYFAEQIENLKKEQ